MEMNPKQLKHDRGKNINAGIFDSFIITYLLTLIDLRNYLNLMFI